MISKASIRHRAHASAGKLSLSWQTAACNVLAWFPAAALGIYLRQTELAKQYLPIARTIGRKPGEGLTFLEKLTFFRLDILICLVAAPLILTVLLRYVAPRIRSALIITLSIAFCLLFFVDLEAMGNIGRYLSYQLLKDALDWGISEPWFITQYIEPHAIVKLVLVIAVIVLGAVPWGFQAAAGTFLSQENLRKWKLAAFTVIVFVSLLVSALGWLPQFPDLRQHRSPAVLTALTSLVQFEEVSGFKDMAPDAVVALYREFTRSPDPVPGQRSRYAGRESASDVIFFVMETGPNRSLDLTGDLRDFPNIASLRNRAFVAERHHSTYPYTSDALFSLFTSYYAGHMRAKDAKANGRMLNSGVFWNLRNGGYATSLHVPDYSLFENDSKMFSAMGVDRQFVSTLAGSSSREVKKQLRQELDRIRPRLNADHGERARLERLLQDDLTALESLVAEVEKNKTSGKRFVTAFMPQLGHGPWIDVANNRADYVARGRALMAIQDRWLGVLLNMLRRKAWLHNTILVVTADHGVRTKKEDPRFRGGMISDYSFHVPMLIFAPHTLTAEKRIPWITSHIDITPTLLDLMGVKGERRFEQGSDIWDKRLADRKVFFHAKGYLGADGFYDNGRYYMTNHLLGSVYANDRLDFAANDLVLPTDPAYVRVRNTIELMRNIQLRWRTLRNN